MNRYKISVIIPVFNNQDTIELIYTKLIKVFRKIKKNYQIIFVDDFSEDNSCKKIQQICTFDKNVTFVKLTKNFGQRFATMAGLKYAIGDYVMNLDADLQDPPEILETISKAIVLKKTEIIIAARKSVDEYFFKKITSYIQHKIMNFLITEYPKEGYSIWCISKNLVKKINQKGNNISLLPLEILNYGFKYKIIYYARQKRFSGKSQWTLLSRINLALEMITLSPSSILRSCLYIGAILLILSFIYIINIIFNYYYSQTPFSGYAPIIIVTLFLGGINIFVVGILAESLSVILKELRSYDKYNIEKIINKPKKNN
jgi:glycosyltransferase involved in cell wall biosynthesis